MQLITMTKAGEIIPVHPDAIREHEQLGWVVTPNAVIPDAPQDDAGDDDLRAEYKALTGEDADKRWGDKRIQKEIADLRAKAQDESASNGLTRREIEADLEGMGVEFDPRDKLEDLAALRDMAREDRG